MGTHSDKRRVRASWFFDPYYGYVVRDPQELRPAREGCSELEPVEVAVIWPNNLGDCWEIRLRHPKGDHCFPPAGDSGFATLEACLSYVDVHAHMCTGEWFNGDYAQWTDYEPQFGELQVGRSKVEGRVG